METALKIRGKISCIDRKLRKFINREFGLCPVLFNDEKILSHIADRGKEA